MSKATKYIEHWASSILRQVINECGCEKDVDLIDMNRVRSVIESKVRRAVATEPIVSIRNLCNELVGNQYGYDYDDMEYRDVVYEALLDKVDELFDKWLDEAIKGTYWE